MPRKHYRIDGFGGIDQSRQENALNASMSPDACNMDTAMGGLSVAKGYVRHISEAIPGTGAIHRIAIYSGVTSASDVTPAQFIACAGNSLYAWRDGAWSLIYTYPSAVSGIFSFLETQIAGTDYLLIACKGQQMVKYDGTTAALFGSGEMLSDVPVAYIAMYRGRLFSAGDPLYPGRLHWSQLPGGTRTVEDWRSVSASPNVEGGHTEIGSTGSDPIIALAALSNQLLIFRKRSIYRLIGDKPGNFVIEPVDAVSRETAHTSVVTWGDVLFFMTAGGLYCFDGVMARLMKDARSIQGILSVCSTAETRGASAGRKLYFTLASSERGDRIIEYDLYDGTYMLRSGFTASDIASDGETLYIVDGARHICRFNEGSSYDGQPIDAWWRTPETDLFDKGAVKAMRELYIRGNADAMDSALLIDVSAGGVTSTHKLLLPLSSTDVLEVPLSGEGRTFSMKLYNEAGGGFTVAAGLELAFSDRRRTE